MKEFLRCPKHPDVIVEFTTRDGRDEMFCFKCHRHHHRKCIDCGRPHGGLTRQRKRCSECSRIAKYHRQNRLRARDCRNPDCQRPIKNGSKLQFCNKKCRNRLKTITRQKKMDTTPAFRTRQLARKKAWRDRNALKLAMYKRKGRLDGTWGYRSREVYLAAMRGHNANPARMERRRAWARDNQRKYGPHNRPTCKECGRIIAWNGRGRPRRRHPKCRQAA